MVSCFKMGKKTNQKKCFEICCGFQIKHICRSPKAATLKTCEFLQKEKLLVCMLVTFFTTLEFFKIQCRWKFFKSNKIPWLIGGVWNDCALTELCFIWHNFYNSCWSTSQFQTYNTLQLGNQETGYQLMLQLCAGVNTSSTQNGLSRIYFLPKLHILYSTNHIQFYFLLKYMNANRILQLSV